MKFLVDECLSQSLTRAARARGYVESSHVVWLGIAGIQDWNLIRRVIDEDWTLVTKNSVDFRGPAAEPGLPGLYAAEPIHAGLVCLNGPPGMNLGMQETLFEHALDEIEKMADLVNQVLEITHDESDDVIIDLYPLQELEEIGAQPDAFEFEFMNRD